MPRTSAWIKNAEEIIARVKATTVFALDRVMIAELFSVSARQAANILSEAGGEKIGGAFIVPRDRLISYLDGRASDDPGQKERERRRSLSQTLADIRAAGPRLRAVRPSFSEYTSSLPDGVVVTKPGTLEITYDTPELVLGIMLAMAELSERSPAAFAESLEFHPSGGEED
jgi:hypothetical protein